MRKLRRHFGTARRPLPTPGGGEKRRSLRLQGRQFQQDVRCDSGRHELPVRYLRSPIRNARHALHPQTYSLNLQLKEPAGSQSRWVAPTRRLCCVRRFIRTQIDRAKFFLPKHPFTANREKIPLPIRKSSARILTNKVTILVTQIRKRRAS